MKEKLKELFSLVKDKEVFLAVHYDADGITSGSLIYHLIKPHAKKINTLSKGLVFNVKADEVKGKPDVIICVDIHADESLFGLGAKVAYIDHHPCDNVDKFDFLLHNHETQSCSLLIWQKLIPDTTNPYFIFLTLLGYFGDGGDKEKIPLELQMRANELLKVQTSRGIHDLMERKPSRFGDGEYLEIERFVSALNTGKRMHWSGDVPFELMKNIDNFKPFIYNFHPIAEQLQEYKKQLRGLYEMEIKLYDAKDVQYSIIECDKNIQGVLCARYMKDKPIIIFNKYNGQVIASMRVPDDLDFDAGKYLDEFSTKIDSVVGGGHEKAGGVTLDAGDLDKFLDLMREK